VELAILDQTLLSVQTALSPLVILVDVLARSTADVISYSGELSVYPYHICCV